MHDDPSMTLLQANLDQHTTQVLENRTGIPITLSLLYMAVAERCGLPMVGLNLPGCVSCILLIIFGTKN